MISVQIIIILMIAAAILAIEVRDMLSSIIALGTVGLMLSLLFLVLKAPDLAVILLIIEILTLTTLIFAAKRGGYVFPERFDLTAQVAAAGFVALFLGVSFGVLRSLPVFGEPIMKLSEIYAGESLAATGATNIVASIALNFRGYDSFAAITVLFVVAVGAVHIMSRPGGRP